MLEDVLLRQHRVVCVAKSPWCAMLQAAPAILEDVLLRHHCVVCFAKSP